MKGSIISRIVCSRWFVFLSACIFLVLAVAAHAQSGDPIDQCSSSELDYNSGVEGTTCLYGDNSQLTFTAEVDDGGTQDGNDPGTVEQLNVDGTLWSGQSASQPYGTLVYQSGYQYGSVYYSFAPQLNAYYTGSSDYQEYFCDLNGNCYWVDGSGPATGPVEVTPPPPGVQGFINPKYIVVGVTYAPPGSSSYVQYTGTTSIGNTTTIASSFSNAVGFSVSVQNTVGIQGWGPSGTVNGTSSTDYTQGSNSSTTTTLSKLTSLSYKTGGTGNSFAPVDSDYDIVWLWLNPVVLLTYFPAGSSTPAGIQWNGYGYDTNDPSGTQQPDIYPVSVGYLNGDFGDDPSIDAVLARSWASSANGYIWPSGQGPGLTTDDYSAILVADPFAGCTYNNNAIAWNSCSYASSEFPGLPPSTTSDGRFTLVTLPNDPNPIPYVQADPGNGSGITAQYSVNQTNTQSVAQGTSSSTKQEFSVEEVFGVSSWWDSLKYTLTQSDTLTWTNSWLNTLTTTTTLQQALSVTGPPCPANPPGPCSPEYAGPGQFLVYQDNQYGTFMFYPTN
jgi:hypothetical protein